MLLWRLSGKRHAEALDGGYGLVFDGRWNTVGHPVTYCATSPALCVLEKLVHIEDPTLLPDLMMVTYSMPDDVGVARVTLDALLKTWRHQEALTQQMGDAWHRTRAMPLLQVPSAIVPLARSPDLNVLVNNAHPSALALTIVEIVPFRLDPRLI